MNSENNSLDGFLKLILSILLFRSLKVLGCSQTLNYDI